MPAEGLPPSRARRLFGPGWRHRLVLGRGMISDDTEQTIFIAQSLIAHPADPEAFALRLAWCLRWWLAAVPAGVGFATLRAVMRLWIGFQPARSGVGSAGSGAAMRVAPIGAFLAHDRDRIDAFVEAATRITHCDSRALVSARAVSHLAAWTIDADPATRPPLDELESLLRKVGSGEQEWDLIVDGLVGGLREGITAGEYAGRLGLARGVTGYCYHVVPVAVFAWYRHWGDYGKTLEAVLDCGGDADTTGAIVGALAGAVVGVNGIPGGWQGGVVDWPRSRAVLTEVADRLHEVSTDGRPRRPVSYLWPAVLPRNIFFLAVVLVHGFRRLLPPY